jgi:hypothetical protein
MTPLGASHCQQRFSSGKTRYAVSATKLALGAIVAAIMGLATPARGYVLEGQSWPADTVVVLQLSLGNSALPLLDGSTSYNEAVVPAINMWNSSVQRVHVTQVMDSGVACSSGDNLNSVVFASSVFGTGFGSSTLAVTYYRYSGSTMREADILFNQAKVFNSYRGPLQFPGPGPAIRDIRRVFLHEFGHALGLNHPDTGGQQVVAVMNSIMSDQEVLSPDDLAGGQFLYGAPSGNPTPTPTPSPSATPSAACHLVNISTRLKIGVSENVLIGGFIIRGTQPKKLILRAIGPSLTAWGVAGAIADPVLELHDSSGGVIATNNDWQTGGQTAEIQTSGMAPANSAESAVVVTLSPGSYTVVVSGVGGGQGIGLVEAYEFDANTTRFINISTRGRVGAGDEPMIGGFIVQGGAAKRVIVRALGPSLASGPSPVVNALADPFLELHDGNGNALAVNDDWSDGSQAAEIVATGLPPANNLESAIVRTLGPGNYTAVVRGWNNTAGVGLVEVYDLDP